MNDLNHYGVKGMEWGKRKKYGTVGSTLNTSMVGLFGTNSDLQKLISANDITKTNGYTQNQLASFNSILKKYSISSENKLKSSDTRKVNSDSKKGNVSSVAGSISTLAKLNTVSKNNRSNSSGKSHKSKNPRNKKTRRPSKKRRNESFVAEDVTGSVTSSIPKSKKNTKDFARAKKRTSNTVRSNANTSISSAEATVIIRQYKELVDQLLRSFSMMSYSNKNTNTTARRQETVSTQPTKPIYKIGTADAKVKTKKRG